MKWTLPNILTVIRLVAAPCVALVYVAVPRPAADWLALVLFLGASLTDYVDGYLARAWNQTSKFGKMLDPIADKATVVIALFVVAGLAGMPPWLLIPSVFILLREVFVSGLREFLGADAGRLSVTRLAKWKTTVQMVAITLLFLALALEATHLSAYATLTPEAYQAALENGPRDRNAVWLTAEATGPVGWVGTVLLWIAAALTVITGWDYFRKALPFLEEDR